jgi:four helix bundle protein
MDKEKQRKEFIGRCISFSVAVLRLTKSTYEPALRSIHDQVVRSATSVGANVCEAQAGISKKEFAKFFSIALNSANETMYWLLVLKTFEPKWEPKITPLLEEIQHISRILARSVITMRGRK